MFGGSVRHSHVQLRPCLGSQREAQGSQIAQPESISPTGLPWPWLPRLSSFPGSPNIRLRSCGSNTSWTLFRNLIINFVFHWTFWIKKPPMLQPQHPLRGFRTSSSSCCIPFSWIRRCPPQSSLPPPVPLPTKSNASTCHISAVCQVAWCSHQVVRPRVVRQGVLRLKRKTTDRPAATRSGKPEQNIGSFLGPEARLFFQSSARGWALGPLRATFWGSPAKRCRRRPPPPRGPRSSGTRPPLLQSASCRC